MSRLAIDVVLLPSDEMMDKAIEVNKGWQERQKQKIILGKDISLPHISLLMGVCNSEQLPLFDKVLGEIAKNFKPFNLVAKGLHVGKYSCEFVVANTPELQKLHEELLKELRPCLSYDATAVDFFNPAGAEILEPTPRWVNDYFKKSSLENFNPHITLGQGQLEIKDFPIRFTSDNLALCHLGNYCTCGKVLISKKLT